MHPGHTPDYDAQDHAHHVDAYVEHLTLEEDVVHAVDMLCRIKTLHEHTQMRLALHKDFRVAAFIAANESITPAVQALLAGHRMYLVRTALASNEAISEDVADILAVDTHPMVVNLLRRNKCILDKNAVDTINKFIEEHT